MLRTHADVLRELPKRTASRVVKHALRELSAEVYSQTCGQPGLEGMGATVVLALIRQSRALIAHMGDSRAYRLRRGRLKLLTKDHSIVQLLVHAGEISPEEAAVHSARGRVTRSVGMEGEPLPEAKLVTVQPNDRLLLCTDGLTSMLKDEEIRNILAREGQSQAASDTLVQAALRNGGEDNVTVIVVDLLLGTGGDASVVSQKRCGAVLTAASQETDRPSSLFRMTVHELDTIGYRRFSGALMSQGLGMDPRGPSRSLDPDG